MRTNLHFEYITLAAAGQGQRQRGETGGVTILVVQVTHYESLDEGTGRGDEKIQIDFRKILRTKCRGFGNEVDLGRE